MTPACCDVVNHLRGTFPDALVFEGMTYADAIVHTTDNYLIYVGPSGETASAYAVPDYPGDDANTGWTTGFDA